MKVNLNFALKDLDGEEIKNSIAGHIVANQLAAALKSPDPVKFWGWALRLKDKENSVLDLDKSDAKTLRDFVENNDNLPVLTKAQVLDAIDNPEQKGPKLEKVESETKEEK